MGSAIGVVWSARWVASQYLGRRRRWIDRSVGLHCVACSAGPDVAAFGRQGVSPARESAFSPRRYRPLPENMVVEPHHSSTARQMVRGLLRSASAVAPKGGIASVSAVVAVRLSAEPARPRGERSGLLPCQTLGFKHLRRWHSAIDPACSDSDRSGSSAERNAAMCWPVVR